MNECAGAASQNYCQKSWFKRQPPLSEQAKIIPRESVHESPPTK